MAIGAGEEWITVPAEAGEALQPPAQGAGPLEITALQPPLGQPPETTELPQLEQPLEIVEVPQLEQPLETTLVPQLEQGAAAGAQQEGAAGAQHGAGAGAQHDGAGAAQETCCTQQLWRG